MTKAKSIDETNAINKPSKGYIAPVQPKVNQVERTSAPNYRKLTQTPMRARIDTLSNQVQYGQPAKEIIRTPKNKVPMKVSNRPTLAAEKVALSSTTTQKSLQLPKRPKRAVSEAASKTIGKPQAKKFKNRFDNPLTPRELEQLRLAQLKGKDQVVTNELLNKLLGQSQALAKQLAASTQPATQSKVSPKVSPVASPVSPRKLGPPRKSATVQKAPTRSEEIATEIANAQANLRFLAEEYPKLEATRQQEVLKPLRAKYGAPRRATPIQIEKLIRDYVADRYEQLHGPSPKVTKKP
jgi:hypothetical protein